MAGLINFNIFSVPYSLRKSSTLWEWRAHPGVRTSGLNINSTVYCLCNYGARYDSLSPGLCNHKTEVKKPHRVDVRVRWQQSTVSVELDTHKSPSLPLSQVLWRAATEWGHPSIPLSQVLWRAATEWGLLTGFLSKCYSVPTLTVLHINKNTVQTKLHIWGRMHVFFPLRLCDSA